jgi:hypothetical protein
MKNSGRKFTLSAFALASAAFLAMVGRLTGEYVTSLHACSGRLFSCECVHHRENP